VIIGCLQIGASTAINLLPIFSAVGLTPIADPIQRACKAEGTGYELP
jgi:hypothetical protein